MRGRLGRNVQTPMLVFNLFILVLSICAEFSLAVMASWWEEHPPPLGACKLGEFWKLTKGPRRRPKVVSKDGSGRRIVSVPHSLSPATPHVLVHEVRNLPFGLHGRRHLVHCASPFAGPGIVGLAVVFVVVLSLFSFTLFLAVQKALALFDKPLCATLWTPSLVLTSIAAFRRPWCPSASSPTRLIARR